MTLKVREERPMPENSTNFNVMPESTTAVGTTLENLKAAIAGETGASAKYAAFAKAAKEQGYDQLSRLSAMDPDYEKPTAEAPAPYTSDVNLIASACGEIYETSDMYPSFIKKAQEEGDTKAVQVFTRAKLAEAVHAECYLEAYNNIDAPDDDKFFLCPMCGYIHKGDDFEKCPICFCPKSSFKEF